MDRRREGNRGLKINPFFTAVKKTQEIPKPDRIDALSGPKEKGGTARESKTRWKYSLSSHGGRGK